MRRPRFCAGYPRRTSRSRSLAALPSSPGKSSPASSISMSSSPLRDLTRTTSRSAQFLLDLPEKLYLRVDPCPVPRIFSLVDLLLLPGLDTSLEIISNLYEVLRSPVRRHVIREAFRSGMNLARAVKPRQIIRSVVDERSPGSFWDCLDLRAQAVIHGEDLGSYTEAIIYRNGLGSCPEPIVCWDGLDS